jgi:hypothetical protein
VRFSLVSGIQFRGAADQPQISPLRYAPVEMTKLWLRNSPLSMENQAQYRGDSVIFGGPKARRLAHDSSDVDFSHLAKTAG